MHVLRSFAALLPLLPMSLAAQDPVPSDAPDKTPSDFVRFVTVGDGGHLDTAVTTYKKGDVELILYGAVHIADAAYYATLNDRFTTCDVLLYELVGPADYRPTKERERGFNPLAMLQQGLKNSLDLTFQLDEVDYQPPNFVHADMTPQEFKESMDRRGESMLSIMLNMILAGGKLQAEMAAEQDARKEAGEKEPPFDLVKAFQNREGRHMLRMTMGAMMEQIELMTIGGPEGGTLLEGRNEKCLEVLQREIAAGRKRIGIFYGAAHFPHMERRLVDDLGFKKVGHEWLVAWDCSKRLDPKYDREMTKTRRRCRDDLAALAEVARGYRVRRGEPDRELPSIKELAAFAPADGAPAYKGPIVDPWGNAYVVRRRPTGSRWEVASAGQDGAMGTADDLVAVEPRRGGLDLFR